MTWYPDHPDLVDKSKSRHCVFSMYSHGVHYLGRSIKIHLYWAMRNCNTNPDTLRSLISHIPDHYQVCMEVYCVNHCLDRGIFNRVTTQPATRTPPATSPTTRLAKWPSLTLPQLPYFCRTYSRHQRLQERRGFLQSMLH